MNFCVHNTQLHTRTHKTLHIGSIPKTAILKEDCATISFTEIPSVVGWRQSDDYTKIECENSEKQVGNLMFRWNKNNYLEVKANECYSHHIIEKLYTTDGLVRWATHKKKYVPEWSPLYDTIDSLMIDTERQYDIFESDGNGCYFYRGQELSDSSKLFNKYSVVVHVDSCNRFQYYVSFKELGPTQ